MINNQTRLRTWGKGRLEVQRGIKNIAASKTDANNHEMQTIPRFTVASAIAASAYPTLFMRHPAQPIMGR